MALELIRISWESILEVTEPQLLLTDSPTGLGHESLPHFPLLA